MTDNKLEAAFARLEGIVTTEIKHLSHDVRNINQKLDAYPTRRDLEAVEARVGDLEEGKKWIWRTGFLFAIGIVSAVITTWIKFSH